MTKVDIPTKDSVYTAGGKDCQEGKNVKVDWPLGINYVHVSC